MKVIGQTKKPEATSGATTTVTPILPCSVRTPDTAAQAAQVSGVKSSAPSFIDTISDSSSYAPQASNPKPASIPAAAPASSKTVKVIGQTKKPEATSRATTTVTPTLPCSVRTPATAAQAAHISEVTSSTPFDIDVGLAYDSCAEQACNFQPASFPATPNTDDKNTPAGAVESVGRWSRVAERQKKLADAMFERQKRLADAINPSNTAATSILPPSYARVPKQPAAGYVDVPRQDAQALPLSGDTPRHPRWTPRCWNRVWEQRK